ncbi:Fur family transcriptional regulator, partial [Xanthovirga aplysinae]|uniref:Fur family transcriptional regulator n=1 Tax=Xanthovirga aplysinae TaxID=2529853 RepID=UPI001656D7C3
MTYDSIRQKLLSIGLKATQQRINIYDTLMRLGNHPRAEQVYEEVRKNNPSISLATVYKTLDTFVSKGLIHKVFTQDDYMRYETNT